MENKHDLEKYLVTGLLAGGLLGSIIGLMFAPKSGKQLRKDIKYKTEDYLYEAESYMKDTKSKLNKIIKNSKRKSESLVNDTLNKVDDFIADNEKKLKNTKKVLKTFSIIEKK